MVYLFKKKLLTYLRVHIQIPDFDGEIIPGYEISAIVAEFDVANGGNDLGEEAAIGRVLGLFEELGVVVAEGGGSHVAESNGPFAAAIDEGVAVDGMKLGGGDDFRQVLHVGRFHVDDVEGLIGDFQVPQVDAEIIGAHVSLVVGIDGNGVDVVRVSVGEDLAGTGLDDQLRWSDDGYA